MRNFTRRNYASLGFNVGALRIRRLDNSSNSNAGPRSKYHNRNSRTLFSALDFANVGSKYRVPEDKTTMTDGWEIEVKDECNSNNGSGS